MTNHEVVVTLAYWFVVPLSYWPQHLVLYGPGSQPEQEPGRGSPDTANLTERAASSGSGPTFCVSSFRHLYFSEVAERCSFVARAQQMLRMSDEQKFGRRICCCATKSPADLFIPVNNVGVPF